MLLAPFSLEDHASAPTRARLRRGRVVWQQRYEGIALIAYQGGRAVAGVSGPWSDRYVLTWWDQPDVANPIELFETLEAAREAVERRLGVAAVHAPARKQASGRRAWWQALWPWRRQRPAGSLETLRRQRLDSETDLSGLNFCASR
jgi:hypothetical protein